ncbi:hypothetical protein CEUSTIGMA_g13965.t1 [Chlamydomonas eustigma]|uniref:ORC6 second cyclin-like domain-containing protein n=1 Tax=Chlamydomonas eustigma TaxID=1157962 RepID=A0A250XU37_9CHLO|nr:hypothetical protein CEUSTIGMA_g13965.t1 [Chlamydomonas eustigma]|eukprot:GAX86558.1 hypothetical protein CEUSTIGMA_g13965.t1 [Chlamydomonas eustigma]
MDVSRLAKQMGVHSQHAINRAKELVSLAAAKTGNLGQVYTCTFNHLQQILGASKKVDLQQLVMKFGCASVRQSVMRVLQLYKDRFVEKLQEADRSAADFSRPVFLAVAFSLVARKNKIKVDQRALLETMCVPREDFLDISASMYQLCFDVVGVEKTKRRAECRKTRTAVMDSHRGEASSSDDEEKRASKKVRRKADYDEWKLLVLCGKNIDVTGMTHALEQQAVEHEGKDVVAMAASRRTSGRQRR